MYFPILPLMPGKMFCLRLEICLSCHVLSSRLDIVLETGHLSFGSLPFFPRLGWLCFMTSHSHLIYEAFACAINFCWLWLCSFNIHKFLQPRKTWRKINVITLAQLWPGYMYIFWLSAGTSSGGKVLKCLDAFFCTCSSTWEDWEAGEDWGSRESLLASSCPNVRLTPTPPTRESLTRKTSTCNNHNRKFAKSRPSRVSWLRWSLGSV